MASVKRLSGTGLDASLSSYRSAPNRFASSSSNPYDYGLGKPMNRKIDVPFSSISTKRDISPAPRSFQSQSRIASTISKHLEASRQPSLNTLNSFKRSITPSSRKVEPVTTPVSNVILGRSSRPSSPNPSHPPARTSTPSRTQTSTRFSSPLSSSRVPPAAPAGLPSSSSSSTTKPQNDVRHHEDVTSVSKLHGLSRRISADPSFSSANSNSTTSLTHNAASSPSTSLPPVRRSPSGTGLHSMQYHAESYLGHHTYGTATVGASSTSNYQKTTSFSTSANDTVLDKYEPIRKLRSPRGLVGLQNLGNTCFMNSVLQCLLNTPQLTSYFQSNQHSKELNTSNTTTRGKLASAFGELVCRIKSSSKQYGVESPHEVKRCVERVAPQFCGYNQQDAQELLRVLLDGLHEDLNRVRTKPPYQELQDLPGETDQERSDKWWRYFRERNDSFLVDVFGGQLMSVVTCSTCQHRSTAFDSFLDISLPIPRAQAGPFSSSKGCSIFDCLRSFTEEEVLEGDEKYYCSDCKKHRNSTKRLSFYRLPSVLVLHIKRFSYNSYRRDKLTTNVSFPLDSLDMRDYVSSKDPLVRGQYDLYAVSHHVGGLGGGHYTATCKNEDDLKWYNFNDSSVRELSDSSGVSGSSAYVLFYKRR
eukprot:GILK01008907.1.p1 GENE.GILK01008907.1~~GILK01008907.1.p1  ORF type:complete len:644 (+),score=55.14 GILK01008907.1:74-2005(+)